MTANTTPVPLTGEEIAELGRLARETATAVAKDPFVTVPWVTAPMLLAQGWERPDAQFVAYCTPARIAALLAELEQKREESRTTAAELSLAWEEIRRLRAQVERGREDAARLQWVFESLHEFNIEDRVALVVRAWNSAHPHGGYMTLDSKRVAIDAARASRVPDTPSPETDR